MPEPRPQPVPIPDLDDLLYSSTGAPPVSSR